MVGNRKNLAIVLGLITLGGVLPASSAGATTTRPSCAKNPDLCTLKGAAKRAGIWAGVAMDAYPPDPTKATVRDHFNSITIENAMKWDSIQSPDGTFNFGPADDEVNWANANGLRVRAHTLLFHRTAQRPWARAVIENAPDPQAKARQLIGNLISNVVGHFRGRVATWDVINEPLGEISPLMEPGLVKACPWGNGWDVDDSCPFTSKNFFYTTLGERYIDEALRAARAADPTANLFINELLWNPKVGDPKADALLALVKRLKSEGVPLDGIGLELHGMVGVAEPNFPGTPEELERDAPTMAGLVDYINRLGRLGVKVEFTEVDISITQIKYTVCAIRKCSRLISDDGALDIQAKLFGRIGRSCAAAPACSGITVWGLTDPETWLAAGGNWKTFRPLLFDEEFKPKPGYFQLRDGLLQRCPLRGTQRTPCSVPSDLPPKPSVTWTVSRSTKSVQARFSPSGAANGYTLTGQSGSRRVAQECPISQGAPLMTCSIQLPAGRWSISLTPSNPWATGSPAVTTARF